MEIDPRDPAFASELEAVEGAAWGSLPVIEATEPLLDDHGIVTATALFSDGRHSMANRVVGFGIDRSVPAGLVDHILEIYQARGAGSIFIPTAPTVRPATLPRLLSNRGFEVAMKEAKLYRSTRNPPKLDAQARVVMATEAEYESVLSLYRGGGMLPEWAEIMAENLGAPSWSHFMTMEGDRPVALASMYVSGGFALCFPGMTLPAYRNRGYQRALTAYRIAAAGELGAGWISVNVDVTDSPLGFTIRTYTRLGYELLYVRNTYVWHQPDVALPDAYSRRMLAPRD